MPQDTETILEEILLNQDKNAKSHEDILENILVETSKNNNEILEEQLLKSDEILKAIKDIPKVEIPEQKEFPEIKFPGEFKISNQLDFKTLEEKISSVEKAIREKEDKQINLSPVVELLKSINEKEITEISITPIIESIDALADLIRKDISKEEPTPKDYTDKFNELIEKIEKALKRPDFGHSFAVVDIRNKAGIQINPATSENQNTIIAALGGMGASSTTPTEYNLTLTSANTEYSQALPANTRMFQFRCRDIYDIRYAFTTGKVATPTAPYQTLRAGMSAHEDGVNLTGKTLYVACATAGQVVELTVWA